MKVKSKKFNWKNLAFIISILLLIIPQTRTPIQIVVNQIKAALFSPSAISQSRQINIEPFSYKLQTLDGGQRDILVGDGSVVFLSYWATWCPPCIAELPSIEKLYEDYNNKVTFLLITDEDPKIVKKFLDKKGYSLPVYMPLIKTPPILFERTIPTNYVIDQNGKIIIKEQGASNWNSEQVREVFDNLLVTD